MGIVDRFLAPRGGNGDREGNGGRHERGKRRVQGRKPRGRCSHCGAHVAVLLMDLDAIEQRILRNLPIPLAPHACTFSLDSTVELSKLESPKHQA